MNKELLNKYYDAISQPQSNYALDNFVDGGQLTLPRRFRQALMEHETAINSYEGIVYDKKIIELKVAKIHYKLTVEDGHTELSRIKVAKLKLKLGKLDNSLQSVARSIKGRERELSKHAANIAQYESEMGFTGGETEEEVYSILQKAEAEYYITKLAVDTAAHLVSRNGGPNSGVLLALQQMPEQDVALFHKIMDKVAQNMGSNTYTKELHSKCGILESANSHNVVLENK